MTTNTSTASRPRVRTLKVYDKLYSRGGRLMIHKRYFVCFLEIRLIGKWLQDCGFEPGQHIKVTTEQHKLIITPCIAQPEAVP